MEFYSTGENLPDSRTVGIPDGELRIVTGIVQVTLTNCEEMRPHRGIGFSKIGRTVPSWNQRHKNRIIFQHKSLR